MRVGDWQSQSKKYYLSLCSAGANSRIATDDIWNMEGDYLKRGGKGKISPEFLA